MALPLCSGPCQLQHPAVAAVQASSPPHLPRRTCHRYAWQEVEDSPSGGDAKARLADAAKDALKEALVRGRAGGGGTAACCGSLQHAARLLPPVCLVRCSAARGRLPPRPPRPPAAAACPTPAPPASPHPRQLTKAQLFCVGDGEFFEECGLVVNKEAWRKKEIRSHTKHVYTQRK